MSVARSSPCRAGTVLGSLVRSRPPASPASGFPRHLLVSVDLRGGRVFVLGDLDRACAHHLLDALAALSSTAHPVWTVDASGVTFCDTEGLRTLAGARALASARERSVRLVGVRPHLAELLGLAGLGHLLDGQPATSASPAPGPGRTCAAAPPSGWPSAG
jgi:anti-sigma B factor antagonist